MFPLVDPEPHGIITPAAGAEATTPPARPTPPSARTGPRGFCPRLGSISLRARSAGIDPFWESMMLRLGALPVQRGTTCGAACKLCGTLQRDPDRFARSTQGYGMVVIQNMVLMISMRLSTYQIPIVFSARVCVHPSIYLCTHLDASSAWSAYHNVCSAASLLLVPPLRQLHVKLHRLALRDLRGKDNCARLTHLEHRLEAKKAA